MSISTTGIGIRALGVFSLTVTQLRRFIDAPYAFAVCASRSDAIVKSYPPRK